MQAVSASDAVLSDLHVHDFPPLEANDPVMHRSRYLFVSQEDPVYIDDSVTFQGGGWHHPGHSANDSPSSERRGNCDLHGFSHSS